MIELAKLTSTPLFVKSNLIKNNMNALTLICQTIITLAKFYFITVGGIIGLVLLFSIIAFILSVIYEKFNQKII